MIVLFKKMPWDFPENAKNTALREENQQICDYTMQKVKKRRGFLRAACLQRRSVLCGILLPTTAFLFLKPDFSSPETSDRP